MLGGVTKG